MMLSLTNTGEGTTPSSSESELNDSLTASNNVGTVFENEGAGNVENGTSDRTNQNMSDNNNAIDYLVRGLPNAGVFGRL